MNRGVVEVGKEAVKEEEGMITMRKLEGEIQAQVVLKEKGTVINAREEAVEEEEEGVVRDVVEVKVVQMLVVVVEQEAVKGRVVEAGEAAFEGEEEGVVEVKKLEEAVQM